jgi:hypothetical protein
MGREIAIGGFDTAKSISSSPNHGCHGGSKRLRELYADEYASKEDYAATLCEYHALALLL